jgi:hypothetical protein
VPCGRDAAGHQRDSLRFARINAVVNGVAARVVSNIFQNARPLRLDRVEPALFDRWKRRAYRHGGGRFERAGFEILRQSMYRLAKADAVFYTGTAAVAGLDVFAAGCRDIWGLADAVVAY